jgi:hypothetical protein
MVTPPVRHTCIISIVWFLGNSVKLKPKGVVSRNFRLVLMFVPIILPPSGT